MIMNLKFIKNEIIEYLKQYSFYDFLNDDEKIDLFANEVIARLFVLSFRNIPKQSFLNKNSNTFFCEKMGIKNHKEKESYDSEIRRFYRSEERWRNLHNKEISLFESHNITLPKQEELKSKHAGRSYDTANLNLIYNSSQTYYLTLLELTISGRICNYKKVSVERFVQAYNDFDDMYEQAKKCKDKIEYIIKWVDIFRLETTFPFSLIYELADSISNCKNKNIPYDMMYNIWGTILYNGKPYQAYQILRYRKYIKPFLESDANYEKTCIDSLLERQFETKVCSNFLKIFNAVFLQFFKSNNDFINDIYDFCKKNYPIIESHNISGFYITKENGERILDKSKVRYARKIIDALLPAEQFKNNYQWTL